MSASTAAELMLQDTVAELIDELKEAPRDDHFDKGYRQGMARALDIFKQQAEVFGIGDAVGLRDLRYENWMG